MSTAAPLLMLLALTGFAAFCLYDLVRAPRVRHLPKEIWALVIVISIPVGGIIYLALGREPADRLPHGGTHPLPPRREARHGKPLPSEVPTPTRRPIAAGSIRVERLSKRFGAVVAVDDLSFEVGPGHVTGFLGPNGAGKTTTMRVILGLEAATAGRTSVDGRPYRDMPRPLTEVGSLLDADAAHPGRSARLHALSVAQSNGIGRHRVEGVLEMTGLASVAHRRVGEFSLGMKQRLGIAVALLGDPPILLFDEPVNGLDPEGVHWIRELLRSLAGEGRTVLVSSHLMSEMARTADHLIIIGRGRLLADTSTQAFVEANARRDVLVRSPRGGELADLLVRAGAGVAVDGDRGLSVTGMESPAIADLALAEHIALHELTPRHATLEEAYLDLTHDSAEYRAGAGTGAGRSRHSGREP